MLWGNSFQIINIIGRHGNRHTIQNGFTFTEERLKSFLIQVLFSAGTHDFLDGVDDSLPHHSMVGSGWWIE